MKSVGYFCRLATMEKKGYAFTCPKGYLRLGEGMVGTIKSLNERKRALPSLSEVPDITMPESMAHKNAAFPSKEVKKIENLVKSMKKLLTREESQPPQSKHTTTQGQKRLLLGPEVAREKVAEFHEAFESAKRLCYRSSGSDALLPNSDAEDPVSIACWHSLDYRTSRHQLELSRVTGRAQQDHYSGSPNDHQLCPARHV